MLSKSAFAIFVSGLLLVVGFGSGLPKAVGSEADSNLNSEHKAEAKPESKSDPQTDIKADGGKAATIAWQPWTDDLFAQATRDHKLVILDLEAVWCHWCHVMEEKTYHDPRIIHELQDHFIAVRVDQDSRPDISNRFEDFGWPATILFDSRGTVLARRSGYIEATETLEMLKAFVADPTPGPSASDSIVIHFAAAGPLGRKSRDGFQALIRDEYDYKLGGWKATHKFLDVNLAEYFLHGALRGDKKQQRNLKQALDTQLALLDPVWGGFYQYSAESDWKHPHYEKIMSIQADNLHAYALALRDPQFRAADRARYQATIEKLSKYVETFLTSPEGAFYVSQDADAIPGQHAESYFALDDAHRRRLRVPKVDQHLYARENGWMIAALTDAYAATGSEIYLEKALRAIRWIMANRRAGALFTHDAIDKAGPYLGDNISMGNAFLKLYTATGDREWLKEAETMAETILTRFSTDAAHPGLSTVVVAGPGKTAAGYEIKPQFEENLKAARFYNLLSYYTGKKEDKAAASSIFSFLASSLFEGSIYASAAILTMDDELANPPLHIVISGKKSDPIAKTLFKTALAIPKSYKILEWWDKAEGPLPNPDSSYPQLDKSAAFVCAEHRCSFPAFRPEDIALRVKQLSN